MRSGPPLGSTLGRRARFNTKSAAHRVSQLAEDFSALRALETFRLLESDAQDALHALHLNLVVSDAPIGCQASDSGRGR